MRTEYNEQVHEEALQENLKFDDRQRYYERQNSRGFRRTLVSALLAIPAMFGIGCGATAGKVDVDAMEARALSKVDKSNVAYVEKTEGLKNQTVANSEAVIRAREKALLSQVDKLHALDVQMQKLQEKYARPTQGTQAKGTPNVPEKRSLDLYASYNTDSNERDSVGMGMRVRNPGRWSTYCGGEISNSTEESISPTERSLTTHDRMVLEGGADYNFVNGRDIKAYVGVGGKVLFEDNNTTRSDGSGDTTTEDTATLLGVSARLGILYKKLFMEGELTKYRPDSGQGQNGDQSSAQLKAGVKLEW